MDDRDDLLLWEWSKISGVKRVFVALCHEQDFSGFVTLAGTAHKEATNLKVGDTFQIGDCEVTSRYDKEKKKEYINFTVYSFTSDDKNDAPAPKPAAAPATVQDDSEDSLPF